MRPTPRSFPLVLLLALTCQAAVAEDGLLPDSSHYRGQLVHGLLQGEGRLDYSDEAYYQGGFKDGQFEGHGNWRDAEGNTYEGDFRDGQFEGRGRYLSAAGELWQGEFHDGSATGQGDYQGADGSRYHGGLQDWNFEGQGRLELADGSLYVGHFRNGEYDGEGTLTSPDGSRQRGLWSHGLRIRDEQGRALPDPLELALLDQGRLLGDALDAVPASTPASELYSLVVAGDGTQSVFLREADYVTQLLHARFAARGQVTLVNHRDHLADRPLATAQSIARAARTLAERSGPEDLLFIYLTSHGSAEHELSLQVPRLQLTALKPLASRDKVVVISACYAGGFIPALTNAHTLVITAARGDRVSFGCSEEADFTYFGRAFFAEALQHHDDPEQAFAEARERVAERERAEGFEASEPQISRAPEVLAHWRRWRAQNAAAAAAHPPAAAVQPNRM
jgi:hypothetical protein